MALLTVTLAVATPAANAQSADSILRSGAAVVQLTATLRAELRLSVSLIHLDIKVIDPTHDSAIVAVPVTSSWVLDSGERNVELVAFFDSPDTAMANDKGDRIPANHLLGGLKEETMAPFVETTRVGTASASRIFFKQPISRRNAVDTRTDTLNIQLIRIDDLGAPAGEYRGILHLRLIAY